MECCLIFYYVWNCNKCFSQYAGQNALFQITFCCQGLYICTLQGCERRGLTCGKCINNTKINRIVYFKKKLLQYSECNFAYPGKLWSRKIIEWFTLQKCTILLFSSIQELIYKSIEILKLFLFWKLVIQIFHSILSRIILISFKI